MDETASKQAWEPLLLAGWKLTEIYWLCRFRDAYEPTPMDQVDLLLDMRHLEFIRWSVLTGRLSE